MGAMRSEGVSELELEWDGAEEKPGGRLLLRRGDMVRFDPPVAGHGLPVAAPNPVQPTIPAPAPTSASAPMAPTAAGTPVTAPIVGTFYASPNPESGPFVKVGDRVKEGQVLCIIEAMKLMNEIEAEVAGVVTEILVRNEDPVEFGQVLMRINPA
jgi:acetyl-CoA carboxylase biotin carboxyl carrier protein